MVAVPLGPAEVDITGVRAGDRNEFQITLTSGGTKLNVTGMTFTASARLTKADTDHLDAVVTIVDGPNGVVLVHWPGDDVRTWLGSQETQTGVWDLEMDDATNEPLTVVAGKFTAELDVTHP
jgi:hypothetical protein